MRKINTKLHNYRLKIYNKIKEYEKANKFNEDVEEDPISKELKPSDVDYLNKKRINKLHTAIANFIAIRYIRSLIKKKQLIIKDVIGLEYLTSLDTGCIITCNHFNPYDNFALHEILHSYIKESGKRFYKVIKEGNYSFKGLYGYFFRHCETLPLSSNFETMKKFNKAIKILLENKNMILIYPEQSMWWNYRKPRPLKLGAFKYSIKHNVPIVPCFITMKDSSIIGEDGFLVQEYTINFLPPIYPDISLSSKEETINMSNRNYEMWCKVYKEFYNEKVEYLKEDN